MMADGGRVPADAGQNVSAKFHHVDNLLRRVLIF